MGKWRKTKIQKLAHVVMGQSPDGDAVNEDERGVPFLQGNADFGDVYPNETYWCDNPKKLATLGGILLSVRAPVGEINIADKQYCIGRGLAAISFFEINNLFGFYKLSSVINQLHRKSQGTTFLAISKSDIDNLIIAYPQDHRGQSKIAEILNTIDTAIEKAKAIIEKYKRIKTGMMQDLLTNGIDEKGNIRSQKTHKYKDSPIGKIPVEWEHGAVSDFAFINPKTHSNLLISDEVDFIPMQGVNEDGIWDIKETKLVKDCMRGFTIFSENDILFAKITPCMENGKGCIVKKLKKGIGFGSTEFHVLRSKSNSIPDYIYYWTVYHCLRNKAIAYMGGSAGQQRVSAHFFYDFLIGRPEKDEQLRIVEKLSAIDTKIQSERAYLEKLQRIKRGLMQDLLTHKVTVDTLL
jgi:type I restriction enzyme S subunit